MGALQLSLCAKALLLLGASRFIGVLAGPSINVALRASFNSAPFLVELLETAAEENSTAYYPLLDRIAQGYFRECNTPQELYYVFTDLLEADGHITDLETLASFQFALSVRSAAPRIEAHYQFYNTSVVPSLQGDQGEGCETWVSFGGEQYCNPDLKESNGRIKSERTDELPFDRILGDSKNALPSIVYADITSPSFAWFHETLSKTAKEGKTSYRVRHKPSTKGPGTPLIVNGYGVELQLKRTDYIVIDDRQAEEAKNDAKKAQSTELTGDEEVADLKPLSSSEVSNLAVNAASFVMKSDQPLDTLLRLVQDFPKHSSAIAAHNASKEFLHEHEENRKQLLPSGFNVMWINGVQIPNRDINPFTLLEHLRRERKLINGIRSRGLSGPDAIALLSHSAITANQMQDEPQRYDFRDTTEGGRVIIWLNDIEKDKRYEDWPTEVTALLQRTFPGQLPSVRRDVHNVIIPVDFSSKEDVISITQTLQTMVKRRVPIRWGLVPKTTSTGAAEQAKVVYHLLETYGLSAVMRYLEASNENKKVSMPDKSTFDAAVQDAKLRNEREALSLADALKAEDVNELLASAKQYLSRLAADGPDAPMFVNGAPVPQADNWMQLMSERITMDLRTIQQRVFEGDLSEETWVPQLFLASAAVKRNPLLIPENEKNITLVNMVEFYERHEQIVEKMPIILADATPSKDMVHLIVVCDFDSTSGLELLRAISHYRKEHKNMEIVLIHNPEAGADRVSASEDMLEARIKYGPLTSEQLETIASEEPRLSPTPGNSTAFWKTAQPIYEALGLNPGQSGLLLNGRFVGPIPAEQTVSKDDIETLVSYEISKRIQPLSAALESLQLTGTLTSPLDFAKLQSLVSLSTVSDLPEGIFESASTMRMDLFNQWNDTHTAITKGDKSKAIFQVVASVDPATELAQKWIPILKVLSDMDGVYLKLFLNPHQRLEELPVKRFYRYLLDSRPTFNDNGDFVDLEAHFTGIPKEALLNLGMDVPPSWLVAPEESIHDLDNIKLSSLSPGADIDATYGLESILIEGHSRDVTQGGMPPRGAELVLSTEKDPHFADTIIMANLGYFQFKANPGFFKIQLKSGRSQEIFNIDSAGTKGWAPVPGDETNEIVLMSFQGATLFPRLSRKPGMETADVLVTDESMASEIVEKGTQKVNKLLNKIGLKGIDTQKVLQSGSKLLSKTGFTAEKAKSTGVQADINIFSVASGHLYERMLNIMMLSVMKHTNHTVKFWFIEQFLSPSFKSFLPTMAAEYGFSYELVTYKWPHWLRGQKEKQREIWGYKILFLDVLFPLDLDKVIFVDADQIVRTDMYELVQMDLHGAPYGFTPMCDSRTEMEGFRFWKQGYWKSFLRGLPYHISALYVVDLKRFRALAAGDRLRQQYHSLSADPASLSNLDQDLPNNMQFQLPIYSLPQEWLWCETWCSDESLKQAKTIDLCNNPQTKEPKLDRARRQVPEWTEYDEEIAALARRKRGEAVKGAGQGKEKREEGKRDGEGEISDSHGEPQAWGGERVGKRHDEL
ncbi:UDP-glucose:glyco protein glucosyltransferase precursor [Westerdykella ornata]|uniref:UDP-glucose:glyco protein glucosyltransferase n=1 Tax=Westerdykella ornata TaxID=318751 RepID=A0A6A6J6B3_WESOR|nr:UDP-glucose:glyco protein glucosyltransferase precursor [Westerdykella ornata]KAF2272120.1 UDP-glucose:glyco protein glucosyltransferase precursor [Westerdykella ornata]